MSNADDNQGRRGLFRRNRSEEPVAPTPPSDVDRANPEIPTERDTEAERKPSRRPGIGRRKAAADGSWSSDVWEDGWDDDWSDRSSRAGVRPAADPRPAEVDAWLASSDDQLGDITRDIARKWTGNKQPAPVVGAITWADDIPATPNRAPIDDPFSDGVDFADADDPFVSASSTNTADSLTNEDDLWDTPIETSDWAETQSDPSDRIDFEDLGDLSGRDGLDELAPARPTSSAVNLGSTWDDVEPTTPTPDETTPTQSTPTGTALTGTATGEPTRDEPTVRSSVEVAANEITDPTVEIQPEFTASANQMAVAESEPSVDIDPEVRSNISQETGSAITPAAFAVQALQGLEAPSIAATEVPIAPSELAFDFAGSTDAVDLEPISPPVAASLETQVQQAPSIDVPAVEKVVREIPPVIGVLATERGTEIPAAEIPARAIPVAAIPVAEIPAVEIPAVEILATEVKIPEVAAPVQTAITKVSELKKVSAGVDPLVVETPSENVAAFPSKTPEANDQQVHEIVDPKLEATLPASAPVERDEFLDSLYEELDEEDVPAERKVVPPTASAESVPTVPSPVTPVAPVVVSEPVQAFVAEPPRSETVIVEQQSVDKEPAVHETVAFAPNTASTDRAASQPFAIPSAETQLSGSSAREIVPEDPNADFDFGPDRPVYVPTVPPIVASVSMAQTAKPATPETPETPAVPSEDDDLFPPTKADRFGAALDQLDDDRVDDQTSPSALQQPGAKKGFLRGRKNRTPIEALSSTVATETAGLNEIVGLPLQTPVAAMAANLRSDKPVATSSTPALTRDPRDNRISNSAAENFDAPDDEDDLVDLDDYDDLEDYPAEAYFSPKLTKLLSRAGFLLVALAAIRMLVLVGLAVKDGASDAQGTQDAFHRIGSAFAEIGVAHGIMLIVGIAMAAAPALLGDPYLDDESRSIGSTFGIGLIAAIFGVFGGFAAARLAMRVNDIADLANPRVSSTTQWAKLAMNLVATAGLSLVAVVAAVRALGGDRQDLD